MVITSYGSDSLRVQIETKTLQKGDTLEFSVLIPDFVSLGLKISTLNVWIEDVERTTRWKYRYPIINGEVSAALAVSDKIPDGRYAVNFFVQRGFLKVFGMVEDHEKRDTSIVFMMIPKNKKGTFIDNVPVERDGSFKLKNTLFADSAYFIFSPRKKVRNNYLSIKLETPLDSSFVPVLRQTQFITVGDPKMLVSAKTDTSHYMFQSGNMNDAHVLPNVTVTSKFKSKLEQYEDEYSRGLFQQNDALVFDGLGSEDISRSTNIMQFLQGRVAGLTISKNEEGVDVPKWRNEIAELYVDEFRVESADQIFITPAEVAMIKVFRPPAHLSSFSGGAGAIAIYTKKGVFSNDTRTKHNFIIKGYTNVESVWD
jgi:hypothetical protein